MLAQKLLSGGAKEKLYVDDVFSTYLYTGNGSTQIINNGIDLAGKGGMVWIKTRNVVSDHVLYDTNRGINNQLIPNSADAQQTEGNSFTGFKTSGFSLGGEVGVVKNNTLDTIYASWTFRKAPKFFDVVTYTGSGVTGRVVSHSLGIAPGMIIVKRTDSTGNWAVYHRGANGGTNPQLYKMLLNLNDAQVTYNWWYNTAPTSTQFQLSSDHTVNQNGGQYVAYLFAHDPSADGIIQCGSVPTVGYVNLGWEPQYVLYKRSDATSDWAVADINRGFGAGHCKLLRANTVDSETEIGEGGVGSWITPTGFYCSGFGAGAYIYLAIRRPNKPPTSGTQVFSPQISGNGNTITTGFPIDSQIQAYRLGGQLTPVIFDRLRGVSTTSTIQGTATLQTSATTAEVTNSMQSKAWSNTGYVAVLNSSVTWNFKRAPGFFDVVCYTGNGAVQNIPHSLGVVPELLLVKNRNVNGYSWEIYVALLGNSVYLRLQTDDSSVSSTSHWNGTTPTSTQFTVGISTGYPGTNGAGNTYVAYLFATLPGVSKVGSYTGNGSSQTINCGFSTGARFILIKRTNSTGDWYVWDSARGIVAANDPHLSLNTTAAEVTTDDSVDPDSSGFIVNQNTATNINVNAASYIFLAIA